MRIMVSGDCENTSNATTWGFSSCNAMDDSQFEQWRELLESRTGMAVAPERRDIVNRLAERLAPGGLLVLGQGELTNWQHPELEPVYNRRVLAWQRSQSLNDNRSDYGQSG